MQDKSSHQKYTLMQEPKLSADPLAGSINRSGPSKPREDERQAPVVSAASEFDDLRLMMINTKEKEGVPHRRNGNTSTHNLSMASSQNHSVAFNDSAYQT